MPEAQGPEDRPYDEQADGPADGPAEARPPGPGRVQDPLPGAPRRDDVRRRLRAQLVRPRRGQVAAAVLLGLLGFGVATQVRSNEADDAYAGLRSADLVQLLNGLNAESRRAEAELSELRETRSRLTDRSQSREAALAQVREQASTLGILAGTLPAQGPGVRITISDPEGRVSLNNLLDGIEELRAGGAEAMEVNDTVRVVAQTSFDTDDGTLLVDGQRVAAPYVLDVIGNPRTLSKVLDIAGGFRYDVEANDGSVQVEQRKRIKIASVTADDDGRYAEPAG